MKKQQFALGNLSIIGNSNLPENIRSKCNSLISVISRAEKTFGNIVEDLRKSDFKFPIVEGVYN